MGRPEPRAILTVDLGYGDAGKGATVDALVRRTGALDVVRYNGGAQAAHNVVAPDGRHHCFAQFGSGSFVPGVRTHLSRFMLIDPLAMETEAAVLKRVGVADAFERTSIDEAAPVITPFQRAANRLKELARGEARHGSCGRGVGETMADLLAHGERAFFARDLGASGARAKLEFLRDLKFAELEPVLASLGRSGQVAQELAVFERPKAIKLCLARYADFARRARLVGPDELRRRLRGGGRVVFEGAQGVLLDEWFGFHPYTTYATTTTKNALTLLEEADYQAPILRLGIVRAYAVRHGPGPFVSEAAQLTARIPDLHNQASPWQREVRLGWFDLVATRYALEATGGVDGLAVTCLDRLEDLPELKACVAYRHGAEEIRRLPLAPAPDLPHQERLTELLGGCAPVLRDIGAPMDYLRLIERELRVPILVTSNGLTSLDRRFFGNI